MTSFDLPGPSPEPLAGRLEFETLIAELSSRFINLPSTQVDLEIEEALRRVCERLDLDLAVLWQWVGNGHRTLRPTHGHPRPADRPVPDADRDQYPWTVAQVMAGRPVVCTSLDQLPAEAAVDRDHAGRAGIKSNLTVPLAVGGQPPVGAVAFSTISTERDWPPLVVQRLELVAQVFANALARRRADEAIREADARVAAGVELAGLGFYETDFAAGTMYADDRVRELTGVPGEERGLQVLRFWLEHLHPADRERILEAREQLHDGRRDRLSVDYRYLHPVRGELWIHHLAGVATRDGAGRAVRTYGVFRDITESRRAEEALRQSYAEIERLKDRLQAESDYLKAEIRVTHAHHDVTGQSAAIKHVLRQIEQVAPTNASVLICGETGTGKERVAQEIHRLSPRRDHLMVKVNCAALPAGLVESELFGREKGAFTGALTRQVGRFELAHGSTLFLDEIGELSLDLQVKLLRVLETGEFERLGSSRTITVDVRLVAATNRDLVEEIRQGRFREDLYYRLNVFPISVPPLRERAEDIPLLVWTFLEEFSVRMGKKITQVPRATMEALQRRRWRGNVRELRNVIEHGAIISTGDTLNLPLVDTPSRESTQAVTLADAEREHIVRALHRSGGHIKGPTGAAAALGLKPATLYSRMKKLGIPLRR